MNREDALQSLHQAFGIWTAANGHYVGTLEEVIQVPRKPWRARLLITGVLGPAQHAERGQACRQGFRPGEFIEVGGINIQTLTPEEAARSTDYLTALQRSLVSAEAILAQAPHHPHAWATHAMVEGYRHALVAEARRLAGEPWRIQAPLSRYEPSVTP